MTRVFVGGYGGLAVGEFADRLIGLAPWGASGGAQPVERPSYVVVSRDRRWVYAVSEGAEGKVVALPADGQGQLARVRSGGADPCHLALSPAGDLLVVSNYSSGTVGLLSVDGGTLTLQDTVHLTGHGPHQRQQGPHAHQATWLSETEVVVCDLGSDSLAGLTLRATGNGGAVPRLTQRWSVSLPPGTGPRHLAVTRSGETMWVVGELDNTVHTVRRDPDASTTGRSGGWSVVRSQALLGEPASTGPAPSPTADDGDSLAAGIVTDPGGRHVYVTVRGADVLIHLSVDAAGELTEVERLPTAHWPRFLGWLPGNRALVVAAERADQLQCFPVANDGSLSGPAWTADWPTPTCLSR
ncbi:MAG TPA: beta-propeller fold lactonase family protein [Ornithinicoccus sp.]|nr:beta-propeller fold lactonase family protein [Ornithinicoccus sp.]